METLMGMSSESVRCLAAIKASGAMPLPVLVARQAVTHATLTELRDSELIQILHRGEPLPADFDLEAKKDRPFLMMEALVALRGAAFDVLDSPVCKLVQHFALFASGRRSEDLRSLLVNTALPTITMLQAMHEGCFIATLGPRASGRRLHGAEVESVLAAQGRNVDVAERARLLARLNLTEREARKPIYAHLTSRGSAMLPLR